MQPLNSLYAAANWEATENYGMWKAYYTKKDLIGIRFRI